MSKMAIRSAFRQNTKICNSHNSTDECRINGTDFWLMTSYSVDVGGSTTPYNVSQKSMIHGVASLKTVFRCGI